MPSLHGRADGGEAPIRDSFDPIPNGETYRNEGQPEHSEGDAVRPCSARRQRET